jgi:uncharacterized protein (TIGR00251 family)
MKINIRVRPNSGRSEIEKIGDSYVAYLKSLPENNKANIELVKLLRKHFKCSEVRISSGKTGQRKVIEILF